jgi:hypothetical protein
MMAESFRDLRSSQDVEEILVQALQTEEDGRSLQERLRESARELGISDAALEEAARRWRAQRDRSEFEAWWRVEKRNRLVCFSAKMLLAAGICLVVDASSLEPLTWSLMVTAMLGVILLVRLFEAALSVPGDAEFERWRRKRAMREAAEASATGWEWGVPALTTDAEPRRGTEL